MIYQMTSQYQPELNQTQRYNQAHNNALHPTIQMSPYMQPLPQQASPVPYYPVDARSWCGSQQPMASPMSLNGYQSHSNTPLSHSSQLHGWNVNQQTLVPPLTLNDDMAYNCNFLGQLQGSYEIETRAGKDQVNVIVPTVAENEEQYAIVRRVCSDGEALPDQFIYQEATHFTLCSVDGDIEGVMKSGSSMKQSVNWENTLDGNRTVWQRKGEVTFNLVSVDSLAPSRRNSLSSVGTVSNPGGSFINSPLVGPKGMPMHIRPELLQHSSEPQSRPILTAASSCDSYASNDSSQPDLRSNKKEFPTDVNNCYQEQAMFELIKEQCVENPKLLKRVFHWAMKKSSTRPVSLEDVDKLSQGRLWITAHLPDCHDDDEIEEHLRESLEDLKGAYREVSAGVWKQAEPQRNEPGEQHRLLKGTRGFWMIEGLNMESGNWQICAKEMPDGQWIDMKNDGRAILVHRIPMSKILRKLKEDDFEFEDQEVEKNMKFLFTSCNQKKLNSKLKGRNLKHNISNLKLKLEKQYALRFAVQVANTADSIVQELDTSH